MRVVEWARLPVVQPAACADHRRPGRLPGRAGRHRGWPWRHGHLATESRLAGWFWYPQAYRRDVGHAAGRHQSCICSASVDQQFRTEYLTRLTDTAALRGILHRTATASLPTGWSADARQAPTGTPPGRVQAVWAIDLMAIAVSSRWCCGGGMIRFSNLLVTVASGGDVGLPARRSPTPR